MPENEIVFPQNVKLGTGMTGRPDIGVKRVQEWLGLHDIATGTDGEFGPGTLAALNSFQRKNKLPVTDFVDELCWARMVDPLLKARGFKPASDDIGAAIVETAEAHRAQNPREIGGSNRGPWVRTYCKGLDGTQYPWCQGFASTIWEQACFALGMALPFALYEGNDFSLYVPWVVNSARRAGLFVPGGNRAALEKVSPGAMFFLRSGNSYSHVGLVTGKHDDGETFYTIEGNTNDDGSPEGYKVCARVRRVVACDFGVPALDTFPTAAVA